MGKIKKYTEKKNGFMGYIRKNVPYEWEVTFLKYKIMTHFCKCVYVTSHQFIDTLEIRNHTLKYQKTGKLIRSIVNCDSWIKAYLRKYYRNMANEIIQYHYDEIQNNR